MSMRDKIADILPPFQDGYLLPEDVADEILAALPDMIPDLVWERGGDRPNDYSSIGRNHYFLIYENAQETWTLDDGEAISSHETPDQAKAAANAHYKAQLAKAMGWAQ